MQTGINFDTPSKFNQTNQSGFLNWGPGMNSMAQTQQRQSIKMFNARQPQAFLSDAEGSVPSAVYGRDESAHKQIEDIINNQFMNSPTEQIYQFAKPGSATHINLVYIPGTKTSYVIANNTNGKIDVIEKGNVKPYKQLNIEAMHCSMTNGQYLIIGSYSKLFLVDLS